MLTYVLVVLAACANATSSALQRRTGCSAEPAWSNRLTRDV